MKIKVGEYIRTKNGVIAKLEYIHNKDKVCWFDKVIYSRYGEEIDFLTTEELPKYVVSHSKNIIDLIEVGDYVNGKKVLEKIEKSFLGVSSSDIGNNRIYNYMIKSIVTKEQFSNMEYRLWMKKNL